MSRSLGDTHKQCEKHMNANFDIIEFLCANESWKYMQNIYLKLADKGWSLVRCN